MWSKWQNIGGPMVFSCLSRAPRARLFHTRDLASLLYVAIGKQLEETSPPSFSTPGQELHDMASIGSYAAVLEPCPYETDCLPMLIRQGYAFSPCNLLREVLGPLRGIDYVAFRVGCE
jgi:hypothetical protein